MYNRYSTNGVSVSNGVSGALMGKTLGVLALLLLIVGVGSVFGIELGRIGIWVGLIAAFVGTWMVSRRINHVGAAFGWGVVVALGMGVMISPIMWQAVLLHSSALVTTLGTLLLAILMSAALVSWLPWDFSKMAPLLFIGLIMLMITGLLSFFVPSVLGFTMSSAYNLIGVIIFTGYLIVDFSLMRTWGRTVPADGAAVVLAVFMLVDIINLFLFLLRLNRAE
ncbi:MAG: Bax inhibitor-1 family protein [Firmicutes bacterium]|nr:Bax inhibitor-1 family protein [Bacillota bacterium]